jgi:O-antigen/teichoic acid export membrane protein
MADPQGKGRASFGTFFLSGSASAVLATVLCLALVPVLTRTFGPEQIGRFQNAASAYLILIGLAVLRYELPICIEKNQRKVDRLYSGICYLLAIQLLVSVCVWPFLWRPVAEATNLEKGVLVIQTLPLFVFGLCTILVSDTVIVRFRSVGDLFFVRLLKPIGQYGVPILLGLLLEPTVTTLAIGTLLGIWVSATYSVYASHRLLKRAAFQFQKWRDAVTTLYEFRRYPIYRTPHSLLSVIYERYLIYFVALNGTYSTSGAFVMVKQLLQMPLSYLSMPLNQAIATEYQSGTSDLRVVELIEHILIACRRAFLPIAAFVCVFAGKLCVLFLGPEWEEAETLFPMLLVAVAPSVITFGLTPIFDRFHRQRLALGLQIAGDLCSFVAITWVTHSHGLLLGLTVFAISQALYNSIWLGVALRIAGMDKMAALKQGAFLFAEGAAWIAFFTYLQKLTGSPISAGAIGIGAVLVSLSVFGYQRRELIQTAMNKFRSNNKDNIDE